ncbi:hypothetical protein SAMN05421543_11520 [Alicyclobacillus macrosporangiidus]|uniref:Uncharacterized protein n=1 Tax=Alicyclobacillus macrosporangiidus TaxID=392015 RepID=A0A1I7KC40_9BACL|nr:hypothetical protein SAMN05421543_11520 [Alicyclobacillus macrosporangiidus]
MILEVRLFLEAPVFLPRRGVLMGDALLFAARARELYPDAANRRDPDQWEPISLPVRRFESQDGQFWAVSALFAPTMETGEEAVFKGTPWFFKPIETSSGILRGAMVRYTYLSVPLLYFFVDVDAEQVDEFARLAQRLPGMYVGQKGQRGMGRIARAILRRRPDLNSAIAGVDSLVLRPVPESYARENGFRGILDAHAIEPPYFHHEPVLCRVRSYDAVWRESE